MRAPFHHNPTGVPEGCFVGFGQNARIFHVNMRKCTNFYKKVCFFYLCVVYYLRIMKENINLQHNRRKMHV